MSFVLPIIKMSEKTLKFDNVVVNKKKKEKKMKMSKFINTELESESELESDTKLESKSELESESE